MFCFTTLFVRRIPAVTVSIPLFIYLVIDDEYKFLPLFFGDVFFLFVQITGQINMMSYDTHLYDTSICPDVQHHSLTIHSKGDGTNNLYISSNLNSTECIAAK